MAGVYCARHFYCGTWLYPMIGKQTDPLYILDFGCGIGRNTYGLSDWTPQWRSVGYDSMEMLNHVENYRNLKYGERQFSSVEFNHNWNDIKIRKFDCIICALVIQHLNVEDIIQYVDDFKKMTPLLVVLSRRFNDEFPEKSNWIILEEQGIFPSKFHNHKGDELPYFPIGDPNDHNVAIYNL
jgi:hypothetical protein